MRDNWDALNQAAALHALWVAGMVASVFVLASLAGAPGSDINLAFVVFGPALTLGLALAFPLHATAALALYQARGRRGLALAIVLVLGGVWYQLGLLVPAEGGRTIVSVWAGAGGAVFGTVMAIAVARAHRRDNADGTLVA